jgi:tetratricopeptide (TPR) repeat protein/transcriptional regulator with XRE-family HTH domain
MNVEAITSHGAEPHGGRVDEAVHHGALAELGTAVGDLGDLGRALRQLVRRARQTTGRRLTCRELADETGYSRSAINNWLEGRSLPSADRLGDLLVALGAADSEQRVLATARDDIEECRHVASGSRSAPPELTERTPQPPVAPPEVKYSLPHDTAVFTGRDSELGRVIAAVTATTPDGVQTIRAFAGMPGIGKTALAVHLAHLLRGRFPDRQLFIDLHAHTPGQEPMSPQAALTGLLTASGVDPRYLPGTLDGLTGLWRDRMAGQRALLILDNAASSEQVTPLLPGDGRCLVLITSRRYLGDLPAEAHPALLEVLSPRQARNMFLRLAPDATGARDEVAELVRLAGHLPLAISLLSRVYARHPAWTLADLIRETRASLLTMEAEKNSVATAIDVSYRYLGAAQQRSFRRLGLHPGVAIDAYAAANLCGLPLPEAIQHLDTLHCEGLLTETGYRRYSLHDLIRRYACDRVARDPAAGRDQALGNLIGYYQHTATRAESMLARQTRTTSSTGSGAPPAVARDLADPPSALSWARGERGNLLACLDHATRSGQHVQVVALTAAMAALLRQDGPWAEAVARHTTAVRAARQIGDRPGQASALNELGIVRRLTGDYRGASEAYGTALALFRDLGDQLGEANTLSNLSVVRLHNGEYPGAVEALQTALGIYRVAGDRLGEANALSNLRIVRRRTGSSCVAGEDSHTLLAIYRDLGDRLGQANVLCELGIVRRRSEDYQGAAEVLAAALGMYRDLGDRLGQANVLCELGIVRRRSGDYQGAAEVLAAALGMYRELGDRAAEAETLNDIGTLQLARGELDSAQASHRQALTLARHLDCSFDEAQALAGLARCDLATGRTDDAQNRFWCALKIFRRTGAVEADEISAELDMIAMPYPLSKAAD